MAFASKCSGPTGGGWVCRLLAFALAGGMLGSSAEAAPAELPFKVQATGMIQDATIGPGGGEAGTVITFTLVETGQATHLGAFAQTGRYVAQLEGTTIRGLGEAITVAANGDELWFVASFIQELAEPGKPFRGTFTYVGGTGRFRGAQGGGIFAGRQTDDTGSMARAEGTLILPRGRGSR